VTGRPRSRFRGLGCSAISAILLHMVKGRLRKRLVWIFCRWLLLGGLCNLAVGVGFGIYTSLFLLRSVEAQGTIIRLDEVPYQDDGSINYDPVFSFTAQDGHTHTVRSGVATNPPGFTEGQTVRVLYIKNNPGGAKLASFWQLWFVTLLCSGLGMFFGGPGYLLLRYERRLNRQALSLASASPAVSR